ncbi:hypothetical protein [Halobacillus sp. BBL2006]|uniref:hypothetical protein n=1 Tax=Halobacillus sp. BBL2006 TaxID=1543706 RepID=UPI000542B0FD|nr:hypothetical protein [Halobacillus sp. BBL2006]KHE67556.1 hypothetical protein LD39_16940 [Halobacillus sp. BBL2006]
MNKLGFTLFILSIMVIGCQASAETREQTNKHAQTTVEETSSEESADLNEIEIPLQLSDHTYTFHSQKFPILSSYIENFENPAEKLHSLSFTPIGNDQFLAEFACHDDACSYLLLDFQRQTSFLLNDLSTLAKIQHSDDRAYIAFLFERSIEGQKKHHLTVMDLSAMEPVSIELKDGQKLIPKPDHYQYSIQSVTFMEDKQIQIVSNAAASETEVAAGTKTVWMYN